MLVKLFGWPVRLLKLDSLRSRQPPRLMPLRKPRLFEIVVAESLLLRLLLS
ncbi:hypothetical protein D3C76_1593050 [compost metagenome]